jgi:hypothetical protein
MIAVNSAFILSPYQAKHFVASLLCQASCLLICSSLRTGVTWLADRTCHQLPDSSKRIGTSGGTPCIKSPAPIGPLVWLEHFVQNGFPLRTLERLKSA